MQSDLVQLPQVPLPPPKPSLTSFKTQYDIRANYNHKGLLEASKEQYQTQIEVTNNIKRQNQRKFKLEPLQIGFVQSLALKDDPKFGQIQKTFAKYNAEVRQLKQNPADGMHLKKVVMQGMLKFMRMMMLAPQANSRKTILDISYYWLIKHLNPKSLRKNNIDPPKITTQIRQLLSQTRIFPQSLLQSQLPSSKLAADLRQYRAKARTVYKDIDAPEFQLQNYHIHKVSYMGQGQGEKIEESQEQRREKQLARVGFPKPNLEIYYQQQEQIAELQKLDMPAEQQPPPLQAWQSQPQQAPNEAIQQPPLEGTEGQAPQAPQNLQLQRQMQLLNQMGGDAEQPQEQPVEEDEDKKRGKLDPFVKVFLMRQAEQQEKKKMMETFQHPPINQLQRYRNNYKMALQKEDQNFSRHMQQYASYRSRFKSQLSRKMQSIRTCNPKTQILDKTAPLTQDGHFHQTRIRQAIRDGRNYINHNQRLNTTIGGTQLEEEKPEPLNTEGGLSCFDRRRVKTLAIAQNKPFSQILAENKRIEQREDSLVQIDRIKEKFAKKKIYTSMQAMKGGLMQPEEPAPEDRLQKVQCPIRLLSNPFFVGKKKKKKGKKKR